MCFLTSLFQGFLPVLYTWITTHNNSSSVQPVHDDHVNKLDPSSEHLTGWKVLLLWIPALCDLTGTTVGPTLSEIILPHHVVYS